MRPFNRTSLTGLLTAGLLLAVAPVIVGLVFGATQLRELAREGEDLVRSSVEVTRHTQDLFRHLASMERTANLYAVLEDPRLVDAFELSYDNFSTTVAYLETRPAAATVSTIRQAAREVRSTVREAYLEPADRVALLDARLSALNAAVAASATAVRASIDLELAALEQRAERTQLWLFWSLAALLPTLLILGGAFWVMVLRPLRDLDRAIRALGRGASSTPIQIRGPTDLKSLGQRLEWLRLRLLESAQEKDRFLRHMSHELKTPLANIREGTDLLVDGAVGPLDNEQQEVTGILRQNAIRLQQLIENLLSYAAWQSQATQLDITDIRLPSLVGTVTDSQRLALAARDIQLDVDVGDVMLTADRGKLKLVLDNLISNALKYTPRGGTIYIRARNDGANTIIDVADTGPGISPQDRDRIFEAFFTGSGPQGGPIKGTGIGLSVVQEFVQAHHGTVELLEGQFPGAHFRVRLPTSQLQKPADAA